MLNYSKILDEYLSTQHSKPLSKDEVQRLWILSKIQQSEKETKILTENTVMCTEMISDNALLRKIANECTETNSLLKNMIKILSKI